MNIDEVIDKLKEIKEQEGNLEVQVAVVRHGWQILDGISTVLPIMSEGIILGFTKEGQDRNPEKDKKSIFIMGMKPKRKTKAKAKAS